MNVLRTIDVFVTDDERNALAAINAAITSLRKCPPTRETALAITKLEEALFWIRQRAWRTDSGVGGAYTVAKP